MDTTKLNRSKWFWMMEYCKTNGLPPAQKWAWDRAKAAWANIVNQ